MAAQAQTPAAVRRENPSRDLRSEGRTRKGALPLPWRFVDGPEYGGRSREAASGDSDRALFAKALDQFYGGEPDGGYAGSPRIENLTVDFLDTNSEVAQTSTAKLSLPRVALTESYAPDAASFAQIDLNPDVKPPLPDLLGVS